MKHLFAIAVLVLAASGWAVGDTASDERELTQLVNDLNAAIRQAGHRFPRAGPGQGLRPLSPARGRREQGTVPGGSQERERGFRFARRG